MAQRLINEIPPHDVFVSAFLGDCVVLRKKRPAKLSIGIDMDRENVDRWAQYRCLSSDPDQRRGAGTLELYCCDAVEWLRHRFGYYRAQGSGFRVQEEEKTPGGVDGSGVAVLGAAADRLTRARPRNNGAPAEAAANGDRHHRSPDNATAAAVAGNGDLAGRVAANGVWAHEPLTHCPLTTFVYIDPPYLIQTRATAAE